MKSLGTWQYIGGDAQEFSSTPLGRAALLASAGEKSILCLFWLERKEDTVGFDDKFEMLMIQ